MNVKEIIASKDAAYAVAKKKKKPEKHSGLGDSSPDLALRYKCSALTNCASKSTGPELVIKIGSWEG